LAKSEAPAIVGTVNLKIFESFQFLGIRKSYGRICFAFCLLKSGNTKYEYRGCSSLREFTSVIPFSPILSDFNNPY